MSSLTSSWAEKAPDCLSVSNIAQVREYVLGDVKSPEYFKVDWKSNVLDGLVEATREDKPILLWLYFGGPLGNC